MTLTRSKVKVKVMGHLNFRQLAKPCMLAAMTAAPLRGFLVFWFNTLAHRRTCTLNWCSFSAMTLPLTRSAKESLWRCSEQFLCSWCPSCHPTNTAKALKESQSTDSMAESSTGLYPFWSVNFSVRKCHALHVSFLTPVPSNTVSVVIYNLFAVISTDCYPDRFFWTISISFF